jgi:hypothetical protein
MTQIYVKSMHAYINHPNMKRIPIKMINIIYPLLLKDNTALNPYSQDSTILIVFFLKCLGNKR